MGRSKGDIIMNYKGQEEVNKDTNRKENMEHMIKFFLFSVAAGGIQALSCTLLFELIKFEYWSSYLIAFILSPDKKFGFFIPMLIPLFFLYKLFKKPQG